jgi:hypothetical protein
MNETALDDNIEFGIYDIVKLEIVNTDELRLKDINFTMGGHYYVYPDLAEEDKIIIDNRMDKNNIVATSVHEFVERTFMKFYGLGYEDAHKLSNDVELVVRKFIAYKLPELKKDFVKGR